MPLSDFNQYFLLAMVTSMYKFEATELRDNPNLLTDKEMLDFYFSYCGV